jgi:hypothetical protein
MAIKKESGGSKKPMAKMAVKGQSSKKTPAQQKAAQVQKAIKVVQKRAGVTAREARDIVTEVGTIAKYNYASAYWGVDKNTKKDKALREGKTYYKNAKGETSAWVNSGGPVRNPRNPAAKSGAKSLMKQVKEVGTAAKTGKAGTSAARTVRDKDGDLRLDRSAGNVSRNARINVKAKNKKPNAPRGR